VLRIPVAVPSIGGAAKEYALHLTGKPLVALYGSATSMIVEEGRQTDKDAVPAVVTITGQIVSLIARIHGLSL
jgi:hypothetical protein